MVKIRVDQSHCNFHLSRWLLENGWLVIFTDAGRVSRGGIGHQGECLKVFEEEALPIPDIIAYKKQSILIFEIDSNINKANRSLIRYKENGRLILKRLKYIIYTESYELEMKTAFCRTGIIAKVNPYLQKTFLNHPHVDLITLFQEPRTPSLYWSNEHLF